MKKEQEKKKQEKMVETITNASIKEKKKYTSDSISLRSSTGKKPFLYFEIRDNATLTF